MPLLSDEGISSHTRSYSKPFVIQDEYPRPLAYSMAAAYPDYGADEDSIASAITTGRSQPPLHKSQDPSRWSSSHSTGARSRSSSIANGYHDVSPPSLSTKPSYDISWQTVDEKDEVAISEEETDDEHCLENLEEEEEELDNGEPTSAALVAEQGLGLIVHADTVPILQLQIQPDTTHLLLGSSTTPNAVPAFLTSTLPPIAHSLLALDISANFLGALPPVLAVCENLEELNVASNPLRVLPVFLADLINLRVLIADSTGITTLPDTLVDLDKLHTISIRRNKLHALPCWLCLLPALQTLCIDGNPFQGPWKALVDPLLAKVPTSPAYPPSTPMMPLSANVQSPTNLEIENDGTDVDDLSEPDVLSPNGIAALMRPQDEEDQTVTLERSVLGRAKTAPNALDEQIPQQPSSRPLVRTRTTPNRAYHDQVRAKSSVDPQVTDHGSMEGAAVPGGSNEIRKMKSAGDLRRTRPVTAHGGPDNIPYPPPISNFPASLSSSNLLSMGGAASVLQNVNSPTTAAGGLDISYPKRFASLGLNSQSTASLPHGRRPMASGRPQLSQSLWEPNGVNENGQLARTSSYNPSASNRPPKMDSKVEPIHDEDAKPQRTKANQKNSRWGFLKKMSMGKMKPEFPSSISPGPSPNPPRMSRTSISTGHSPPSQFGSLSRMSKTPQIDVRFSTTGALDAFPALSGQQSNPPSPPSPIPERPVPPPSAAVTNGLLAAPSAPRTVKRRSFLPIDAPGQMSLSIPENSKFVSGVVVSHDGEDHQQNGSPVSNRGPYAVSTPVVENDQLRRKEEERARDAYMRALRSVMAYLKDMNDLSHVQQSHPVSMYGTSDDQSQHPPRSRRPTVIEREGSSGGSTADSHLRSPESLSGMRSGSSSQTLSVATTDSTGSQDERKFKDDKGRRAMVIREIVATERTYVRGLQELVDIYIQPACAAVNLLSGSKDSVVPASERKVVFGGIESLFSFHKDSFLPALEGATATLMKPSAEVQELDADGQLSLNVAKAVGHIFVKHAAFMRMYSSYINNFDSSVQRVKYWTSDKYASGNSSPGIAVTPSSSSAHLAGLGLSLAGPAGVFAESLPTVTGIPNLSTSQRKRIKTYLKRCRLNPRHTQLNLEGYLLLPVQRIPRYKLLLEELVRSTPPPLFEYLDDPLDRALSEITALASNMNEGKRDAESRRKLVRWQTRIRGKFPSPLVQPHRKLIMDGPLLLTRVVRKAVVSFEAINAQGDLSTVQVDCLAPELTPRPLVGILCNDLLVLCRDPSEGQDPSSPVDLWAVLRMQTLPQPASIVHGNALRLVDNKAILYFDAPSPSDALNWYRAINLHIPASKA